MDRSSGGSLINLQNLEASRCNLRFTSTWNIEGKNPRGSGGLLQGCSARKPLVVLDGQKVEGPGLQSDRSWRAHYRKESGRGKKNSTAEENTLQKKHGLQGPIDDGFMDSFIVVLPTSSGFHSRTDEWVRSEAARAIEHWRKQFRGEARVLQDTEVTSNHIANASLVLWGDPKSNQLL